MLEGPRLSSEWIHDDLDRVRAALQPLLELPVERILLTHGEPVLAGARGALARALG
jgi:hypothetical protein